MTPFPKEAPEVHLVSERPSGSFTSGGFPKEAPEVKLVLKKARPSASSRRKGVLRLPPEGRASFGLLPKEGRPSASFGKLHLWRGGASFGKLHLWRFP